MTAARLLRLVGTLAVLAASLAAATTARAAERDEGVGRAGRFAFVIEPRYGYVILGSNDEPSGWGIAARLYYGITEAVGLQVQGSYTGHGLDKTDDRDAGTLAIIAINAGASFAIDAIPLSPMLEAGIGLLQRRFGDSVSNDVGIRIGLSMRYWLSDWIALGFSVSYHGFLTDPTNVPVYVELGPQIALRWPR